MRRTIAITLAAGGAVILVLVAAVALTRSPPKVVGVGVPVGDAHDSPLGRDLGDASICQPGETLPAGTTAVRLGMWAFYGAKMHVRVYSGSRVLTEGSRGPNWTSDSVTVPVRPLARRATGVVVCVGIGPNSQPLTLLGVEKPSSEAASTTLGVSAATLAAAGASHQQLGGKLGIEYLSGGGGSWWSHVVAVAKRMGYGRAFSGTWIALLVVALMAAVGVFAVRLTLREAQ